jgi:hypothetical protein
MTRIQKQILKKIEALPEIYLREILDFVDFIKQKEKKDHDTRYLAGIKGVKESVRRGRKENTGDCKTLEDIGWR